MTAPQQCTAVNSKHVRISNLYHLVRTTLQGVVMCDVRAAFGLQLHYLAYSC